MILNLAMLLEDAARRKPQQIYLRAGEEALTYAQVERLARQAASVLASQGVAPGERVALLLPNSSDYPPLHFSVLMAGAVPIPLFPLTPAPEIAQVLRDSHAAALIVHESFLPQALQAFEGAPDCRSLFLLQAPGSQECPLPAQDLRAMMAAKPPQFETYPTRPEDLAGILYTAGTTGLPKGVALTHFNYYFTGKFLLDEFWQVDSGDVILMVAPASHIFGQALIVVACQAQAQLVILPRFDPEAFLNAIQRYKVSFIAGVPALLQLILHHPVAAKLDLTSLRRVMVGGAPLHPALADQFRQRTSAELITGYGMTEGVPVTYLNAAMMAAAPAGTVGLPALGTTVRVVDASGADLPPGEPGELWVRGPQMSPGYLDQPTETAAVRAGEWYHTGDVGYKDAQGYIFLIDRLKDLIKTSGYSVFPAEVERALHTHPAVAEAAVVGMPHPRVGEVVHAFVVLKPGAQASERELIAFCKSQLTAYKCPRRLEIRAQLPKNSAGKVLRRALRVAG